MNVKIVVDPQMMGWQVRTHRGSRPTRHIHCRRGQYSSRSDYHLRRQMVKQESNSLVNLSGFHQVIVIKNKNEIIRDGGDFIEQGRQDRFDWRRLRGLESRQQPLTNFLLDSLQRCYSGRR